MAKLSERISRPTLTKLELWFLAPGRFGAVVLWVIAVGAWPMFPSASGMLTGRMQEDAKTRMAVETALPYLAKETTSWISERGCVSCHRVSFMIWSHQLAVTKGFRINETPLEATTNWALTSMLSDRGEFGGVDTISQILLGRNEASRWREKPPLHFKSSDPYETLFQILLERQSRDGSWPPEGQLTTPADITTRWALLALDSFVDPAISISESLDPARDLTDELAEQMELARKKLPESRRKAWRYLELVQPHATHESLLLQCLLAHKADSQTKAQLLQRVLERQNGDGGWSNRLDVPHSDAFATGQTLYALSVSGLPIDDDKIERAREFLIRSQETGGHWLVPADRIRNRAGNERLDEVFSYWGTAWATIGLLSTLPDRPTAKK